MKFDNNAYSNHRVQIYDSNGQWKQSNGFNGSGDDQINYPLETAFNFKSHMVVANEENYRIQIFFQNTQFIKGFGLQGNETVSS